MIPRLMLRQERKAIKAHVLQSPTLITVSRIGTKIDAMGNIVADYDSVSSKTFTGRISRKQSQVPESGAVPAGLDTAMVQYLLTDYQTPVYTGDSFGAWRIGQVTAVQKFGGVIGYEAILIPQTDAGAVST